MEKLPAEIITNIIKLVIGGDEDKSAVRAAGNLRLVSRRFKSLATIFLVPVASVHLSSKSFSDFEDLCSHSEFRLGITHVKINASYYDVELAEDRHYFGTQCSSELCQTLEYFERGGGTTNKPIWNIHSELAQIDAQDFVAESATVHQKIIMNYHKEYQSRTADQEELRRDNTHIRRLCKALSSLPALETITLYDKNVEEVDTWLALEDDCIAIDDPSIFLYVLHRSTWSGTFMTAFQTRQPHEMLGELLAQMGNSGVRPRIVKLNFSLPVNLLPLGLSLDQSRGVAKLVSKVTKADIYFHSWARQRSLAVGNDRSVAEMCALGSIITALTNTSTLQVLHIHCGEYPVFHQFPNVCLDQLLPVRKMGWPQLRDLVLQYLPVNIEDIASLVRRHTDTIYSLRMIGIYLRDGDWDEVVELLHGFTKLNNVEVRYPKGGRYRERWELQQKFPAEKVNQYILKKLSANPVGPQSAEATA